MKRIELERESVQIGIYSNIIISLLDRHNQLSVIKTSVFAYLIKKNKLIPNKIYNAKNTHDIIEKCISLLSGDYEGYCNNIQYIIKSIHILISAKKISLNGNLLIRDKNAEGLKSVYIEDAFMEKAVKNSKRITDKQFLKEVIQNV